MNVSQLLMRWVDWRLSHYPSIDVLFLFIAKTFDMCFRSSTSDPLYYACTALAGLTTEFIDTSSVPSGWASSHYNFGDRILPLKECSVMYYRLSGVLYG